MDASEGQLGTTTYRGLNHGSVQYCTVDNLTLSYVGGQAASGRNRNGNQGRETGAVPLKNC